MICPRNPLTEVLMDYFVLVRKSVNKHFEETERYLKKRKEIMADETTKIASNSSKITSQSQSICLEADVAGKHYKIQLWKFDGVPDVSVTITDIKGGSISCDFGQLSGIMDAIQLAKDKFK